MLSFNFFELFFLLFFGNGVRIREDRSVNHPDDSCRICFRKLGIVGDHQNESVFRYLFEDIHDLNAGFRIKCTGRLIGKDDVGIGDQSSCDGDSLTLTAGKLVGFLVYLVVKSDFGQSIDRFLSSFGS